VADANVIINLIHIGRLALLAVIPGYNFVLPDDVRDEIVDAEQRTALEDALEAGVVQLVSITDLEDLAHLSELRSFLGRGEAACLVLAQRNGWLIASDERRRFRREVHDRLGDNRLITTPGLLVLGIRADVLSVGEADEAKRILEGRRFRMAFESFGQLIAADSKEN
jgi:predicted nucleic acid-binding protein